VTAKSTEKLWLSGNEALALGAFEAGVKVASGYPGTPSTEIMENLSKYEGVYTEWAPNEKVGLEVALGASFVGVRSLATMKHVGMNVAADPLFTSSYTGIRGGLVIINADDPEMHSSQNEQDNRNYAFAAKLPMLEGYDTPVIVRTTTRIAHVKGQVAPGEKAASSVSPEIVKDAAKFVMLPANARNRRKFITERMQKLAEFAETFPENRIEWGDGTRGFITSGISYLYVKEAFPKASVLKLGMVWPLPEKMIRSFAEQVDELFIVEELDPFLELHIKAMGIRCRGKELIPAEGELNPGIVKKAITGKDSSMFAPVALPPRPPNMCPGCPHRGLFYALSKQKVFVAGDIGCYTLGFLPPLSSMDSCVCMGAGVSGVHGMAKALGEEGMGKEVAVIGDSTFVHSGITGLINIVYNDSYSTVIILDNRITAMTGQQPNPASGTNIKGEPANMLNFEELCRALGVKNVVTLNPHNINETRKILREEIDRPEPSVVISRAPCVLIPAEKKRVKVPFRTIRENCTGCMACIGLGCPAIHWVPVTPEEAVSMGFKEKQKGYSAISTELCNGCGQCMELCKFDAIAKEEDR
jgi:indolepyruvate ferredoxin oxidoreductase alpha subunit